MKGRPRVQFLWRRDLHSRNHRIYRLMLDRATEHAGMGKKVIVDATYLRAEQDGISMRPVSRGLNPFFIHCFASEAVLKERIRKRMEAGTDISDGHRRARSPARTP